MPNVRYEAKSPTTVYGRTYTFFVMDEAHSARKHNLARMGTHALRERSTLMVAMTATPMTTKPQVHSYTNDVELITPFTTK